MSKKREIIILEPDSRIRKEAFCSAPKKCPCCYGRGYFPASHEQPWDTVCPDCEGTGEVVALVTVDWKPNNNK